MPNGTKKAADGSALLEPQQAARSGAVDRPRRSLPSKVCKQWSLAYFRCSPIWLTTQRTVPVTLNGRQSGLSKPTQAGSSAAPTLTKRPSRTIKVKAEPEDGIEIPPATKKSSLGKKASLLIPRWNNVLKLSIDGTTRIKADRCWPRFAQFPAQR
jgi:hypothetical protein